MKKTKISVFIFISLLFVLLGCKKTVKAFLTEVSTSENYVKTLHDGVVYIKCAYRPPEFLVLRELENDSNSTIKQKPFEDALKSYEHGVYFEVRIGMEDGSNIVRKDIRNQDEFKLRVNYLNYGLLRDFFIIKENGDKVYPISYNYYNLNGISNTADFIFVFSRAQLVDAKKIDLYYTDHTFNIQREIHFSYPIELINKKENIKFE